MKTVMAFGTFDILHPGHTYFLKQAKALGDKLIVVIGRDLTVERVKGRKPVNTESVRVQNLEATKLADEVLLGTLEGDKHAIIKERQPNTIALGYDQEFFLHNLPEALPPGGKIVRLSPFKPEKYKSSLLRKD